MSANARITNEELRRQLTERASTSGRAPGEQWRQYRADRRPGEWAECPECQRRFGAMTDCPDCEVPLILLLITETTPRPPRPFPGLP